MGFGAEQLRDKALAALEEAAELSRKAPVQKTKALGFALAYLWAYSPGDRSHFIWFWRSLGQENDIGRRQNVHASLNGIYRTLRLERSA